MQLVSRQASHITPVHLHEALRQAPAMVIDALHAAAEVKASLLSSWKQSRDVQEESETSKKHSNRHCIGLEHNSASDSTSTCLPSTSSTPHSTSIRDVSPGEIQRCHVDFLRSSSNISLKQAVCAICACEQIMSDLETKLY